MNTKKILLIIAFVMVVIGFGAMIYFVFIRDIISSGNTNNINNNENINSAINGLPITNTVRNVNFGTPVNVNQPTISNQISNTNRLQITNTAQGGLTEVTAVVPSTVEGAEPNPDGDGLRYYDKFEGKFYSIDANGNMRELSDQLFPDARDINWSPTDDKVVVTFPDESKVVYDFSTNTQVTLPREWDDVNFSPSGSQIGFKNMSSKEDERWLAVANFDGSNAQLIEPIGDEANNVAVNWSPTGQVLALFRDSTGFSSQEVLPIGLHGENFKAIETDGKGFEGIWSPDGQQLLYTIYNADSRYNPTLHLVDASGDQIGGNDIDLGLQTWTNRCAFSEKSSFIYCAVPAYLPTGSGIYPEAAKNSNDSIYKINTNTGAKNIVALPSFFGGTSYYSITSLFLSSDEKTIYFTNETNQLFSIQL